MKTNIFDVVLLTWIGAAAIHRFGWLEGLGTVAVVYLLMPYYVVGSADVGEGQVRC